MYQNILIIAPVLILKRIWQKKKKNYGTSSIRTMVYCPVFHGHSCCTYNKKSYGPVKTWKNKITLFFCEILIVSKTINQKIVHILYYIPSSANIKLQFIHKPPLLSHSVQSDIGIIKYGKKTLEVGHQFIWKLMAK